MKTKKKLLSALSIMCAFALIFGGVFAFFSDSALLNETAKVGTVDVEVDGGLIHSNNLNNLNPGDNDPDVPNDYRSGTDHELSFTVTNNGNKSVVTRTLIEVSGVKKDNTTKLTVDELKNIILSEKLNVTEQTTQNSIANSDTGKQTEIIRLAPNGFEDNKLFYVIGGTSDRGIQDVLNGTGDDAETETNVDDNILVKTFDIGLDKDVTNEMFQGATITFKVTVQAMQYRNTGDEEWDNIFEADYTIIQPAAKIPEGGTYYTGLLGSPFPGEYDSATDIYIAGDDFPETVNVGDVYVYGDYVYKYGCAAFPGEDHDDIIWLPNELYEEDGDNLDEGIIVEFYGDEYIVADGWGVSVRDRSKSSYGTMLSSINGKDVITTQYTYLACKNLTEAPVIAESITDMSYSFWYCDNLTEAPVIPESVNSLYYAFAFCTSLTETPVFHDNITNIEYTFTNCTSLTKVHPIPTSITDLECTFHGCSSLTTAPVIHEGILDLDGTFCGCTSLTGIIEINANPETADDTFLNVDMSKITLTGSASKEVLNDIGESGDNWTPIE